jgi:hypothetical protein
MIKNAYINILETSSVSLSTGSASTSYPLYRIYDRDIGRLFKAGSSATLEILINQGTAGTVVDRMLIPPGHNLIGMALSLQNSTNGSTFATVYSCTQADTALINATFATDIRQYWRLVITSPATAPQIPELFLTRDYTWESDPHLYSVGSLDNIFNVENDIAAGGQDRFMVFGNPKKQRNYKVVGADSTQETNIQTFNNAWAGCKPFWLFDHNSQWIYGKLVSPLNLKIDDMNIYRFDFNFLEVLP